MTEQNTLVEIIKAIFRWKKVIIGITIITAIVSSIIALTLPVYYKSTEVFYPYNLQALHPKNVLSNEIAEVFGTNNDVERMQQIGISSQLAIYMIDKFDLYKRYGINSKEPASIYEIAEIFKSNYSIIKNDRSALEISVFDKDPQMAALMASAAVNYIDSINRQSLIENNEKLFNVLKASLDHKYNDLEEMEFKINKAGIGDVNLSNEVTSQSLIKTNNLSDINAKLAEKLTQIVETKEKFNSIKSLLHTKFNTIFVIEKATPAIKKAKPVRWLIVASSTFIAFFLTLLAVMIIEYYRSNLREIIQNAK